jgi:D-alanyl-D-alanine carboxypeptidase
MCLRYRLIINGGHEVGTEFNLVQPLFMKIVNTREHSYSVTKDEERFDLVWQNTNRLLEQGFDGIKTGNTDVAGPCLAASTVIQTKN